MPRVADTDPTAKFDDIPAPAPSSSKDNGSLARRSLRASRTQTRRAELCGRRKVVKIDQNGYYAIR
jgi:hypothetical protein